MKGQKTLWARRKTIHFETKEVSAARTLYTSRLPDIQVDIKKRAPMFFLVDFVFPFTDAPEDIRKKDSIICPKPTKPDNDNSVKLFQDVVAKKYGFQDHQISILLVGKYWGDCPGVALRFGELDGMDSVSEVYADIYANAIWFLSEWKEQIEN